MNWLCSLKRHDEPPVRPHTDETMPSYLNVMIEGCCHGALDDIYAALREVERRRGVKVDLLICCGDFQGLRSEADFEAAPAERSARDWRKSDGGGVYISDEKLDGSAARRTRRPARPRGPCPWCARPS